MRVFLIPFPVSAQPPYALHRSGRDERGALWTLTVQGD
jgi:hypothetical protein